MAGLSRPSHYDLLGTAIQDPGRRRLVQTDRQRLSSVPPSPGITLPFPPPKVRTTVPESLPPAAEQGSQILDLDKIFSPWETSSGAAHGPKPRGNVYRHPAYPLPCTLKKTLGIKDFGEKLQLRPCQYPSTMAYKTSEVQAKYQGWPILGPETNRPAGPQPWELADHHVQGPSQAMIPSSKNPDLSGRPFYVPEQGVLDRHQHYLTTTARDFRYYTRKELASYPRNNLLTHQNSREQPRLSVPLQPLPLANHLSQAHHSVPHRGALPLTKESYGTLQSPLRLTDQFYPLETPWVGPQVQPVASRQPVPHVYQTENSRYGSLKPAFV